MIRPRDQRLSGFTDEIITGDGKMYVTLNYDQEGLREIFIVIGRCGGTIASMAEGLGRQISMLLQHRIPIEKIAHHLIGIRSVNASPDQQYLSIPDALGQVLKRAPLVWPEVSNS